VAGARVRACRELEKEREGARGRGRDRDEGEGVGTVLILAQGWRAAVRIAAGIDDRGSSTELLPCRRKKIRIFRKDPLRVLGFL
jgi:hypothetical protein